jgi:hypothetical protein
LQHIQKVLIEPHREKEISVIKEDFVNQVNITHQVLDEGIGNTFILEKSLFLDEEKKEGTWGLDFEGSHLLSLKFRPHMATRTPHHQNSNEVIHGTELISQHSIRVKNYTK